MTSSRFSPPSAKPSVASPDLWRPEQYTDTLRDPATLWLDRGECIDPEMGELVGCKVFPGRYPSGILTNPALENFEEPKVILVTDPWADKSAVGDATRAGIIVVGCCDTNNQTNNVDLALPCNNKGKYVGICGQAPSDSIEFAEFIVRCGIQTMSLNPDTMIKTTLAVAELEKKMGITPE